MYKVHAQPEGWTFERRSNDVRTSFERRSNDVRPSFAQAAVDVVIGGAFRGLIRSYDVRTTFNRMADRPVRVNHIDRRPPCQPIQKVQ